MKILEFTKAHDLSQLHDELLAIPALRPVPADHPGLVNEAVITVEGIGDTIILTVPDNADEQEIEKVVKAHTPIPRPKPATKQELKTRLDKANSIPELKEIVSLVLERLA